jgi:hypothetical protein
VDHSGSLVDGLRLEVLDFDGLSRWRWRLTDAAGVFLADHQVELDTTAWQFEAFTDLYRYLRWNASPDHRLAHEEELVGRVGEWIGKQVLGPVATAMASAGRPVRLELPSEAALLGYLPWELAVVDGRTLAQHRVNVIVDQQPRRQRGKADPQERLRMLAVFSLPEDAGALNLRKERFELAQLVQEILPLTPRASSCACSSTAPPDSAWKMHCWRRPVGMWCICPVMGCPPDFCSKPIPPPGSDLWH